MSNVSDMCGLGQAPALAALIDALYTPLAGSATITGTKTFAGAVVSTGGFTASGTISIAASFTDKLGFFAATPVSRLAAAAQATVTATATASGNGFGFCTEATIPALVAAVAQLQYQAITYGFAKGTA